MPGAEMIPAWIDGVLTPVEKLDVHRRGLRHKAVSVFVIRDNAVLLQQRALGKYHTPGLWANTCCTHPAWDETGHACAIRRLHQELGIDRLSPQPKGRVEYRADVGAGLIEHELVEVFVAEAGADLVIAPDADEVMAIRWAPIAGLAAEIAASPEKFTPWLRIYLADHAETIFGANAA